MKMRNKGKVHPSSSSSAPVTSPAGDSLSVLNLLPAAILSLALVVLSLEDREVLAYMITSYWFKWDSSPNRELIHEAIEAFDEALNNNEQPKKKGKKKEKMGHRRLAGKGYIPEKVQSVQVFPASDVAIVEVTNEENVEEQVLDDDVAEEQSPETEVVVRDMAASQHKGLARKVLPDVIGLFNWRLWSLWSPNV
ncbi:uncharacterized protein [Rutidosis leptorrhynchoides]|uniref:uncharacterized protein n=1 Tax=Rutidosis leptorrhynchoides TaxID=125765 RepID=UPI003A98E617